MNAPGPDLLRMLGAQATPGLAPAQGAPRAAIDFAQLLSRAKEGSLPSGREVTIARGAGVQLSEDQLARLAAAADAAEAQGATRALVMMDGIALKLDVSMREVTGAVDLNQQNVLTGIDAVVKVPQIGAARASSSPSLSSLPADNPSLLSALLGGHARDRA